MKELNVALKAVAEGLRTIALGVEKIARKLEHATAKAVKKTKAKAAPKTRKTEAKKAPKTKKAAAKKVSAKKVSATKAPTAEDTVLKIITGSKNGVSTGVLADKTGFDKKKVASLVFKLSKQGKIKSVSRGVYTSA